MKAKIAVPVVMLALAMVPATAAASSGQFTRAWANPSWTAGSLAGSATWTDCQQGFPCKWLAYISAQPSLPVYGCLGDEALDGDPNTTVVWTSSQTANNTVNFDLPGASILHGVQGQRVCLSVIYGFWRRDPVCVAQAPIFGKDPETFCPYEEDIFAKVLSSKLLEPEPPPPPPALPPSATAPATSPPSAKPRPRARRCPKGKRRVQRNGKVRCVKKHRR